MKVLVAAAVGLGPLAAAPAGAQCPAPPSDRPTLTVRGTGSAARPPDVVRLDVSVVTNGPTLDAAVSRHRDRVGRASPALDRLKPEGLAVEVGSFGVEEEREPPQPNAPRPEGARTSYRAVTRYELTLHALDRTEAVVLAPVGTDLFEVDTARYAVEDVRAALDEARRNAVTDARRQADVYAEAAGLRVDGVERMANDGGGRVMSAFVPGGRSSASGSVGIVAPKVLPFDASITVTWRLAPR